jgi:hypothetical protein
MAIKRRLLSFAVDWSIIELTGDEGGGDNPFDCPGSASNDTG